MFLDQFKNIDDKIEFCRRINNIINNKHYHDLHAELALVGSPNENGAACLASVDLPVPNGKKLF